MGNSESNPANQAVPDFHGRLTRDSQRLSSSELRRQGLSNARNSDLQGEGASQISSSDGFSTNSVADSPDVGDSEDTCSQSVGNSQSSSLNRFTGNRASESQTIGGIAVPGSLSTGNGQNLSSKGLVIDSADQSPRTVGSGLNVGVQNLPTDPNSGFDGFRDNGPKQTLQSYGKGENACPQTQTVGDGLNQGSATHMDVRHYTRHEGDGSSSPDKETNNSTDSSENSSGSENIQSKDHPKDPGGTQTTMETSAGSCVDGDLDGGSTQKAKSSDVSGQKRKPGTHLGMSMGFEASSEARRLSTKPEAVAASVSKTSLSIGDSCDTALSEATRGSLGTSNLASSTAVQPDPAGTSAEKAQTDAPRQPSVLGDLCGGAGRNSTTQVPGSPKIPSTIQTMSTFTATSSRKSQADNSHTEYDRDRKRTLEDAEANVTRWMEQHAASAEVLVAMETAVEQEKEAAIQALQKKVEEVVAGVQAAGQRAVADLERQASSLLQPLQQQRRHIQEWQSHASEVTASSRELRTCAAGVQLSFVRDVITRKLEELVASGSQLATDPMELTAEGHFRPELDLSGVLDGVNSSVPCYVIQRLHADEFIPADAPVTSNTNVGEKGDPALWTPLSNALDNDHLDLQASEAKLKSWTSDDHSVAEDSTISSSVFAAAAAEESDQESSITQGSSSIPDESHADFRVTLRCKTIWSKRIEEFKSDEDPLIRCLCVDPATGQIIVGDLENERLQLYSPDGRFLRQQYMSGCPCSAALGSSALVVVIKDQMYFYETPCWDLKRKVTIPHVVAENDAPAPTTVTALSDSTFVVGNLQGNLLLHYDSDGRLLRTTVCPVQRPILSICEDHEKNLLISSWNEAAVVKVSREGKKLKTFRRHRSGDAGWYPNFAITTKEGFVVVADFRYNDMVVFAPDGNVALKEKLPKVKKPRNLAYDRVRDRIIVSNDEGCMACLQLVHETFPGAVSRGHAPSVTDSLRSADYSEQESFMVISSTEASELKSVTTEDYSDAAHRQEVTESLLDARERLRSESDASESAEAAANFESSTETSADPGIKGEITSFGQVSNPGEQQSAKGKCNIILPESLYEASFRVEWVERAQQTASDKRSPHIGAMAYNAYNKSIIFLDRANSAIRLYRHTGDFIKQKRLNSEPPSTLCCGGSGMVAVVESGKLRLLESRSYTETATASIEGCLGSSPDTAPLVARAGFSNILVCRLQGNVIQVYDLEGNMVQTAMCPVKLPISSVASCGNKRFLLCSSGSQCVALVALDKKRLRLLHEIPLAAPRCAVMDQAGFVVAIHGDDHELVVFDPDDRLVLRIEVRKVVKPTFLAYNNNSDVILVANESGSFASLKLKYFLKGKTQEADRTFQTEEMAQLVPVDVSYLLSTSSGWPFDNETPSSDMWSLVDQDSWSIEPGALSSSAAQLPQARPGLNDPWTLPVPAFPEPESSRAKSSSSQVRLETRWMRQMTSVGNDTKEPVICALTFNTHAREIFAIDTANQTLRHYDTQGDFMGLNKFRGGAPTSIACGRTTAAAVRSGKLLLLETETYEERALVEIPGSQGKSPATAPLVTARSDGSFALARLAGNKIEYVDSTGRTTFTLQSAARAPLTSLTSDPDDNLLVSSPGSGSVVLFPQGGGRVQRSVVIAQPRAAVVDRHGYLVVIDGADNHLVVFCPKNRLLLRQQLPGLPIPAFLAYDGEQDQVYVASEAGALACLSLR